MKSALFCVFIVCLITLSECLEFVANLYCVHSWDEISEGNGGKKGKK